MHSSNLDGHWMGDQPDKLVDVKTLGSGTPFNRTLVGTERLGILQP